MKRIRLITATLAVLLFVMPVDVAPACQTPESELRLYQDMLLTSLDAQLSITVHDFYGEPVHYSLQDVKIIDVRRQGNYSFDIKMEVMTFTSSQACLGIEQVTFRLEPGVVELLEYQHVRSYPKP